MTGSLSGVYLLLFLVSFCLKADSQRPGVILAVKNADVKAVEILAAIPKISVGLTNVATIQSLKKCADSYNYASRNLGMTIEDLKEGNYIFAPTFVGQALHEARTCRSVLVAELSAQFDKSCSEALSIVKDAFVKG